MSEEELDWEVKRLEGMVVEMGKAMERNGTGTGVRALPGVKEFLGKLREVEFKNFGVVTSGWSSLPCSKYSSGMLTDRTHNCGQLLAFMLYLHSSWLGLEKYHSSFRESKWRKESLILNLTSPA